ncbi:MAG: bifunctional phosphoribosylaminoimidazolecarboxamide formyltransferase/IMP cyclohydrolase [Acholeplasmatales bacterium]|nr:bifunctional phosphoribosylaminoimidazolecarboxamide formyltransferase/IMP cyclohydrolase [Acholeplasmatales bacterium]
MRRALISVSDKTNVVEFAKDLINLGYEIISTGGTKKALDNANVNTISVEDVTGFPEILDGRVKTLNPFIHGGLLAVRDNKNHMETLKEHNITPIDLVCVNLYPFKETIERNASLEEAIENIDIGGPSMLRSASKNYKSVTVVCDPLDYNRVIEEIKTNGDTLPETRLELAAKVYRHTASYDTLISSYLTKLSGVEFAEKLNLSYDLAQSLRYGENPHQHAALYKGNYTSYSIVHARQIQGKELSYNNIQDANACLSLLREFSKPTAIGLKHMNPCGVASADDILTAWNNAYNADSVSIYGGIVAFNREVDEALASDIMKKKVFLEIIMAPSYTDKALEKLSKKTNCRIMEVDMSSPFKQEKNVVSVNGGLLYQDSDNEIYHEDDLKVVTKKTPTEKEMEDLLFAMRVVKHVKSNAILVAHNQTTCGVGAGQMNRVGSAEIALKWANDHNQTSLVLASDAFFPFDDTITLAAKYGVTAVIQPGGSIRDMDSIKKADELGISMVFTGMRHFKH